MAATVCRFKIAPIRRVASPLTWDATTITADATQSTPPVPTLIKLVRTANTQVEPAASYAVSVVAGWMYAITVNEALVGSYYWYCEDVGSNVIADGFIFIAADDVGPYYADSPDANAATAATQATAARNLAEADVVLELDAGIYKQKTLQRGTTTELIPDKVIKQPSGSDLTNPATQRFGGAAQEPV